jgi:hypothetical protein
MVAMGRGGVEVRCLPSAPPDTRAALAFSPVLEKKALHRQRVKVDYRLGHRLDLCRG